MRPEKDKYRVIQWATGGLGTKCIRSIQQTPHLEIVGAWVSSEAKHGRDVGEIAGIAPMGVKATMHHEEIYALDADIVHYAPALPNWNEVVRLLESGKNVLSPLHFTFMDSDMFKAVHAAGIKGNASYYGTGIYPDWSAARLVLLSTSMCDNIRKITLVEQNAMVIDFSNAETTMFDVIGYGAPPEAGRELGQLALGFLDCLRIELKNVAAALGYALEDVTVKHEFALAIEDIRRPKYQRYIKKGTIAGWKTTFTGTVAGKPVFENTSYHISDVRYIDRKDWQEIVTDPASYEVIIDGDPPTRTKWTAIATDRMSAAEACYLATAMNNLAVIPGVCAAKPGIVSSLDMTGLMCGYGRLAHAHV